MYTYKKMNSPIGPLFILCDNQSLVSILFEEKELIEKYHSAKMDEASVHAMCALVEEQLTEYFNGERMDFSIPVNLEGTPFQMEVWEALSKIPYGTVKSYQEIAVEINRPLAVRAVGQANRRNSLPIIIPCHRVNGKNQALVGYAGDRIGMKEQLLKLEGVR
ncbi:methylated-DNA--[protein]-cysteine S-methyltransferase [Sutcliffiella sp. NPDC057660]|uniref:methylated-DNA--[protein]-cysteine S-methyltransferase n=1 Tax=Sutcliffiella sp. NPDC057660 TaxID=3346199 RepID=UPI0036A5A871